MNLMLLFCFCNSLSEIKPLYFGNIFAERERDKKMIASHALKGSKSGIREWNENGKKLLSSPRQN